MLFSHFLKYIFLLTFLTLSFVLKADASVSALQKDLAKVARETHLQEEAKLAAEEKLKSLEDEKYQKNFSLEKQFGNIVVYLKALRRIHSIAPASLLDRSMTPEKLVQSTVILNAVIRRIFSSTKNLREELDVLQEMQKTIERQREEAHQATEACKEKYAELEEFLRQRKQIMVRESQKRKALEAKVERLAHKSQNIRELIYEIDASQSGESEASKVVVGRRYHVKPVVGSLIASFGNKNQLNPEGMGVVFKTEPRSLVYSPLNAQVVYAGAFRKYNHMVILSHDRNYHTVILGLGEIDVAVGQSLLAGEPIGYTINQAPSHLYLELREGGVSVDPAPWLKRIR